MDPVFEIAYERAAPFTLLPRDRCEQLWRLACTAPDGDFAEVGVYRGGSAMLLRAAGPDRALHLFDTFVGHPEPSAHDSSQHHYAGKYGDTDADEVRARVGGETYLWGCDIGLMRARRAGALMGMLWTGVWPASAQRSLSAAAFVHIDVDLYESTCDALTLCAPVLVSGGVIVCDDFLEDDCPGVRKAVEEFLAETQLSFASEVTTAGQAVLRRLS